MGLLSKLPGLNRPKPESSTQQRMVELGNAEGLRIRMAGGDTTITEGMIEEAEINRRLLIEAGPGYIEFRRGW